MNSRFWRPPLKIIAVVRRRSHKTRTHRFRIRFHVLFFVVSSPTRTQSHRKALQPVHGRRRRLDGRPARRRHTGSSASSTRNYRRLQRRRRTDRLTARVRTLGSGGDSGGGLGRPRTETCLARTTRSTSRPAGQSTASFPSARLNPIVLRRRRSRFVGSCRRASHAAQS